MLSYATENTCTGLPTPPQSYATYVTVEQMSKALFKKKQCTVPKSYDTCPQNGSKVTLLRWLNMAQRWLYPLKNLLFLITYFTQLLTEV